MALITDKRDWSLTITSHQEYTELVRLIKQHGWDCCDALKEEDGWQRDFCDIYWNIRQQQIWIGRGIGTYQIKIAQLPEFIEYSLGIKDPSA